MRRISMGTRDELLEAVGARYRAATRTEKGRILTEFAEISGYHRKHAERLLRRDHVVDRSRPRPERRVYDDAVREALVVLWEAGYLVLAFAPGLWGIMAGLVLWGLHMGFTQGILATLVADSAPPELRGTAFGMFNLVTGAALLTASVIAGVLWDAFGAEWTFLAGAVFAALTIAGLIPLHGSVGKREDQAADEGKLLTSEDFSES
jgi:MFS family permease